MRVEVRPGRPGDLPGILEVYNPYVLETPISFEVAAVTPEDRAAWMQEHLSGGRHRLFVATDGSGRLVGWATSSRFRERAAYATTVESSVYCRQDARGAGVGTRLYETLFAALQEQPIERIVAGITLPNLASEALHRRFGFRPVGVFTRVGFKLGRFWDVGWFERPLRDPAGPGRVEGGVVPTT